MANTAAVKSAIRVIEIFEYFESSREPRSLKEIVDHLQDPQSSSTVLLKNLVGLGYLSYDCRMRKYFPTPRLSRLGDWVGNSLFGESRVLSLMSELQKATGELIGLGIQNDINIQYLKVVYPSHALPYFVPEGNLRELTQSAGGWMLLSQLPARKLDYTIRRVNLAAAPDKRVNVQQFIERMAQVKRDGHAYAENIPFENAATLSVSLPITLKGQPAVLGVSGHLDDIQPRRKELNELLRHGASLLRGDEPIGDLTQFGKIKPAPVDATRHGQASVPGRWYDALGHFEDADNCVPAHG